MTTGYERQMYHDISAIRRAMERMVGDGEPASAPVRVFFSRLHPEAKIPTMAYPGDAGWDLYVLQQTTVPPRTGVDMRTGIAIALPPGYYARIIGRSSTLRLRDLLVVEGVIDAGFRGELFSYTYNPGDLPITIQAGRSLAQVIISPAPTVLWDEVEQLPPSKRGEAGFGSSGS